MRRADGSARLFIDGRVSVPVEVAGTAGARRRGLLGRDGLDGALWLVPCKQAHTFRMRFAIDVAHVSRRGEVLSVTAMAPGRLGAIRLRSRAVLEAEAGRFVEWGLRQGSTVLLDVDRRGAPTDEGGGGS